MQKMNRISNGRRVRIVKFVEDGLLKDLKGYGLF